MNIALSAGERIDRYRVDTKLGEGGMALVYRVQHVQLGTWHALKVLRSSWAPIRDRLLLEGRVQAQLQHPNIVAVTDVVEVHGAPGLVMEYVAGPSLDSLLRHTRLSIMQADMLGRGIIAGVAAAHEQGLIHRDLKPANILLAVGKFGVVPKVADFGLAKLLDTGESSSARQTRTGVGMGTPAFMSPEQLRDAKNVDCRADVFALGAILYELACGARAFDTDDVLDLFAAIAAGQYVHPREHAPELPSRMVDAIVGALEPDRDKRWPDCASLLQAWTGEPTEDSGSAVRLALPEGDPFLAQLEFLSSPPSDAPRPARVGALQDAGPHPANATPSPGETWGGAEGETPPKPTLSPNAGSDSPSLISEPLSSAPCPAQDAERTGAPRWIIGAGAACVVLLAGAAWQYIGPTSDAPPAAQVEPLLPIDIAPPSAETPGPAVVTERSEPEPAPVVANVPAPELVPSARAKNNPPLAELPVPPVTPPALLGNALGKPEPLLATLEVTAEPPIARDATPPAAVPMPILGTVRVTGDAKSVWLQSSAGNFRAGELAPGNYTIKVFFEGMEARTVGDVTVVAGQVRTLFCQKAIAQCTLQ